MSEEKPRLFMANTSSNSGTAGGSSYCYSDHHQNIQNDHMMILNNHHLQSSFVDPPPPDTLSIYNTTNMNNNNNNILGFQYSRPSSSSSKLQFYNDHLTDTMSYGLQHHEAPSSSCVFPCEGNERPSQGLSLSLSSTNPSSIGLQSFELRQHQSNSSINHHQHQFSMRDSKYLEPAQELLHEFCNLGLKDNNFDHFKSKMMKKSNNSTSHDDDLDDQDENIGKLQALYSLDILELQRRKSKLLQLLEQVDRRYKHYCNQMKGVVESFEAVAGNGAALVYSSMASRAMSRHFRCLRDGIVKQIKATKKALGDKDQSAAAPGTIKGETPRLRVLDQTLRQQKALQQMSLMEAHPWRPQRGLPERSVSVLRAWLFEHFLHPYPSDVDKHILARQTGLSRGQVSNWFINARVRLWKPMVEEMYLEELKEQEGNNNNNDQNLDDEQNNHNHSLNEDQKPTHDQLLNDHSESLSSIFNNQDKSNGKRIQNMPGNSYGAMELDFSSPYSIHHHPSHGGAMYGGGGVSLTLGLHQTGGNGGRSSLALSSQASHEGGSSSLYYSRSDEMDQDCNQTVQYSSLLDSHHDHDHHDEANLPYRNLLGAQLLHDLAG